MHVITQPQLMAAAAADVAGIGSAISEANAVASGLITDVAVAGADEVSAAAAALFSTYAEGFRAVINEAASFHDRFARALAGAENAYAQAESANAAALTAMTTRASAAATTTAVIMGGSGSPIPDPAYVSNVLAKYIVPRLSDPNVQALFTPEGLYPLFGPKDLTLDVSVARGVTALDNAIQQQLAAGNPVTVLGLSQSAVVASLEMARLDPAGVPSSLPISFTLLGDPMNPNGGLLSRFAGLTLPSLGITAYGATPSNSFPTDVFTVEYDGYADFPRYPINVLSDLNALAGIVFLHDTYPDLTATQLASAITLPTQGPTQTTYHLIPTKNLPILEPLRALPLVGNPIADLIQPDLKVLVNLGYGDPAYGYSTSPANVPTPLGLFPSVNPGTVLTDLIAGIPQGFATAGADLGAEGLTSPPSLSPSDISNALSALVAPGPGGPPGMPGFSVEGLIEGLQTANSSVAGTIANTLSTSYSTLLPTADIANAVLTSMPSYDLNLFADGISQAAQGDPMGLVNAVGYPIAADTALLSLAGGWELIVLVNAVVMMFGGQLGG